MKYTDMNYTEWLKQNKSFIDIECGYDVSPDQCPDWLFTFQKLIAAWSLRRGRAAIFADTGLGKTRLELAWAERVSQQEGKPVLILAPLCVTNQTVEEARRVGVACEYHRKQPLRDDMPSQSGRISIRAGRCKRRPPAKTMMSGIFARCN